SEAIRQRDFGLARAQLEECLALRRLVGSQPLVAHALLGLGNIALRERDDKYDQRTATCFDEALTLFRATGDGGGEVAALLALGGLARVRGRPAEAASRYDEGLTLARELGRRWAMSDA